MIKVICSDADGILNDLAYFQDWMVYNYYVTQRNQKIPKIINPKAYDISEKYEISKVRRNIIWLENFKYYCLLYEARKDAFEVLKAQQQKGKKVAITTARAFVKNIILGPTSRRWYEEWQSKYDFVPNEIVYCSEKNSVIEKAEACRRLKPDLSLEDKINNLETLLDISDCIALSQPWNEDYVPAGKPYDFYIHDNWKEVEKTIEAIDVRKVGR